MSNNYINQKYITNNEILNNDLEINESNNKIKKRYLQIV